MAVAESGFRAMGGEARILVVARRPEDLIAAGAARVAELEARWTRFDPGSEIRRLAGGGTLRVSADTRDVVRRAVSAWRATGGRFDPTVAVAALGYDRDYAAVRTAPGPASTAVASPGCGGIEVDDAAGTVTLPPGVALDLGAVGKGRAADLVVELLLGLGARGACVNLGGDLRVAGDAPTGDGWVVAVEDPFDPSREIATLALADGAVATSSVLARRWQGGHHVVDPATGRPAATRLVSATVVAGEAWWAEAQATAALVAGGEVGAPALLVTDDGEVRATRGLDAYRLEAA